MTIDERLSGVSRATELFARQSLTALQSDHVVSAAEQARYAKGPGGALYTQYDNGGTAGFYSNLTPVGAEQLRKVWRLSTLSPLMKDLKNSHPLVSSLYFNSYDSYNLIYPYMPLAGQYPADMNIPSYNFYYEADAAHNPGRKVVWTDAYVDPAGHGWMVSSIAPVWNGEKLEGVVGLDVTLDTIIKHVLTLPLPWDAYAVLLDRQGRIVAMPAAGERDFGLRELTGHVYNASIKQDTFKPEAFDLSRRKDMAPLARALASSTSGNVRLDLHGPRVVSHARISGPEWTLLLIAPEHRILQGATTLRERLQAVGYVMLAGLFVFYALFFAYLYRRSREMGVRLARPIGEIARLVDRIAAGRHRQVFGGSAIRELDSLGHQIVGAGYQLGDAHDQIVAQERTVTEVLSRERQVHEEQTRFLRVMSHDLRTPLSVIDSGAQILERKAASLTPEDLRKRSSRIRAAVRRITELLQNITPAATTPRADVPLPDETRVDLADLIARTARESVAPDRLDMRLAGESAHVSHSEKVRIAFHAALDAVARDAPAGSPIRIDVDCTDPQSGKVVLTSRAGEPQGGGRGGSPVATAEPLGMDLFVARSLLEAVGGAMAVAADQGTCVVTFTLPVDQRHDA